MLVYLNELLFGYTFSYIWSQDTHSAASCNLATCSWNGCNIPRCINIFAFPGSPLCSGQHLYFSLLTLAWIYSLSRWKFSAYQFYHTSLVFLLTRSDDYCINFQSSVNSAYWVLMSDMLEIICKREPSLRFLDINFMSETFWYIAWMCVAKTETATVSLDYLQSIIF